MLATFVPWLMLNRDGLNVLLHPETGDDYADHARHAVWFGQSLKLKLEIRLREQNFTEWVERSGRSRMAADLRRC